MRVGSVKEVAKGIRKGLNFAVLSHINPDGDALGAAIALQILLEKLGKTGILGIAGSIPRRFFFLPRISHFQIIKELPPSIDTVATVDSANLSRIGEIKGVDKIKALINLDHHPGNPGFGRYNLVDEDASCVSELISHLYKYFGMPIGKDEATCMYVSLLTDTGGFRYSNTTRKVFAFAGDLMDAGIDAYEISKNLYEEEPLPALRLLGMALSTLSLSSDGKVAWIEVTRNMYSRCNATEEDTEGLVNYPRSIKGVEIAILFRESSTGEIRISLRSKADTNVAEIAEHFGGGGHPKASACRVAGEIKTVKNAVLKKVL